MSNIFIYFEHVQIYTCNKLFVNLRSIVLLEMKLPPKKYFYRRQTDGKTSSKTTIGTFFKEILKILKIRNMIVNVAIFTCTEQVNFVPMPRVINVISEL